MSTNSILNEKTTKHDYVYMVMYKFLTYVKDFDLKYLQSPFDKNGHLSFKDMKNPLSTVTKNENISHSVNPSYLYRRLIFLKNHRRGDQEVLVKMGG